MNFPNFILLLVAISWPLYRFLFVSLQMVCFCDYYLNIIFHRLPDNSLLPCSVIQYVKMYINGLFCSVILFFLITLLFYCTSIHEFGLRLGQSDSFFWSQQSWDYVVFPQWSITATVQLPFCFSMVNTDNNCPNVFHFLQEQNTVDKSQDLLTWHCFCLGVFIRVFSFHLDSPCGVLIPPT